MEVKGSTANHIWKETYSILNNLTSLQPSRVGDTSELLHVQLQLENPRERWVLSRLPIINPAFALVEVIWIMSGRDDAQYLNYWNSQLPKYAGSGECYHGAYGNRLRSKLGLDQLERAYHVLSKNPHSRQVVLEIWNSEIDFPDESGQPVAADIPCNTHAYLLLRDGRLEWTQLMRSNDIMLGLPYNLIQFTSLQEIIAGWLAVEVGGYHHFSNSLHLYETNRDKFDCVDFENIPSNTDSISVSKDVSDRVFSALDQLVSRIAFTNLSEDNLKNSVMNTQLPESYKNWLYVIAAEEARKKSWHTTMREFTSKISNPLLKTVWDRWHKRVVNPLKASG